MIVYNLSIKVDRSIQHKWMNWQRTEFIPSIIATGSFTEYKFFHLLDQDESDGFTYVLQCFSKSVSHYQEYIRVHANNILSNAMKKWNNQILVFGTAMEVLQ
ncbi:MAG: DUF4286 family protein [Chitinophagaceae bacterium]